MESLVSSLQGYFVLDATRVTVHEIFICDEHTNQHYVTSAYGTVIGLKTATNADQTQLRVTLDMRMAPFPIKMRKHVPLFKNMGPDTNHPTRTIYKDEAGLVYIRIKHVLNVATDNASIPGVVTGQKCKDSCRKKCLFHQINQPYRWIMPNTKTKTLPLGGEEEELIVAEQPETEPEVIMTQSDTNVPVTVTITKSAWVKN